ncbi:elongation factor Ts [Candidatus Wolfebacteria bacterium]|nr:elongation factor Ts [Candidatus Wolfebacteria bacterium]
MSISTDDIKALRQKTSVSIMQCKKALEDADGDMEQAIVLLKKRAGAIAEKKSGRDLGAGTVMSYIHGGEVGSLVMLSCETDFVGKNKDFVALAREIAMQVAASDAKYISDSEITPEAKEAAHKVFVEEVQDKPEDMREKILEGKMKSYFKDMVILSQPYIKDPSKTVADLLSEATQKFGERIEITRIARFTVRG